MDINDQSFLLFGGKGGNGKTTSACATALHLARNRQEKRIMIVSTDPAHSIGDSFNCTVGSTVTPIVGVKNLWALELAAEQEADYFRQKYDVVLKKIVERGTLFDQKDIEDFFSLSIPGLDEIMAIIKVANFLRENKYDIIILDTAPTGHTMKLLAMPDELKKWLSVLELMQSKHRFLVRQFTGRYKKDDADRFLKTMKEDIKLVSSLLRNGRTSLFIPVVIPEYLPVKETERLVSVLKRRGIPTQYLIVNRIKTNTNGCTFCTTETANQAQWLDSIRSVFSKYDLQEIPAFPYEINGKERLTEYGQYLFGNLSKPVFQVEDVPTRRNMSISSKPLKVKILGKETSFIIIGGKGGVGKTSLASATALHLAAEYPTKKVLIFSTDPAHSLSESFDTSIGEDPVPIVQGLNLHGLELNAEKIMADFKRDYRKKMSAMFGAFVGVDIKFDREIMEELIESSPPGMDEMMALTEVMEFVNSKQYDIYVFDSSATGHLLNFLSMPEIIRDWLKAIFRLQIKYQNVMELGSMADELLDFSKKVRKVQSILQDEDQCDFIALTIPEMMGIRELNRMLRSVKKLNIPGSSIVVNMVRTDNDCSFCRTKRNGELLHIDQLIKEKATDYQITQIPLFSNHVKGIEGLNNIKEVLYGKA